MKSLGLLNLIWLAIPAMLWADEGFVVLEYQSYIPAQSVSNLYKVKPGDTLAGIVSKHFGEIENRKFFYTEIISANPLAFVNGDPNKLLAGSTLILDFALPVFRDDFDEIYFF